MFIPRAVGLFFYCYILVSIMVILRCSTHGNHKVLILIKASTKMLKMLEKLIKGQLIVGAIHLKRRLEFLRVLWSGYESYLWANISQDLKQFKRKWD